MSPRCDICCGAGSIKLPVHNEIVGGFSVDEAPVLRESARSFPCPQCQNMVREERIQIITEHREFGNEYDDPALIAVIRQSAASALAQQLVRGGYVRTERSPTERYSLSFKMAFSIGVVHPDKVTSMESRARQCEDAFAAEVVQEAQRQILNWDSEFTGRQGLIIKDIAAEEVDRALREVTRRRKKPTVAQSLAGASTI